MIKTCKLLIPICTVLLFVGCDKDFVKVNTNPYSINSVDPALLFAGSQRSHIGTWNGEHTIVQQFVSPYNTGANLGFNFNEDVDGQSNPKWDQSYAGGTNGNNAPIKNMMQALSLLGQNTARVNLQSMIRIWKAQVFMGLVDDYGDVPYSQAGKAVSDSNAIFYPKYDDDAAIYDDLYKELKGAVATLNPSGDYVSADLFYGANAQPSTKTANAADQVAKWKKLGNSLLLRLGMRYSKINPTKAASIVAEAFAGGVMTSNADNAFVKYDGTLYTDNDNLVLRNFSQFNCAAEPFVNQLKLTNDPRAKFMIANFADPGNVAADPNPDVVLANQFGVPIGIDAGVLAAPPYRGSRGGGLNYSQFNVNILASPAAPDFWVTYGQTSLLLAEAAKRGWIAGGDASAKTYYEDGITADMLTYSLYPGTTPIAGADITTYINDPGVLYNSTDALMLINTQYWIVNIRNGTEAFANFRRSGYPALTPNPVVGVLGSPGFARRLSYPDVESSANAANYQAAAAAMGGDKLTSRVFWDTQ
ncbi:MAG TPA: SusD/RagB family nutrient-binding outer membrane lipoprotein [Hanamia sp.]